MGTEWTRMTRREFVGIGIASLAAAVRPAPALASAAPWGSLRLGMAGAGGRGAAWLPRLGGAPGVAWCALSEPDGRRLGDALRRCAEGGAFPAACGDEELAAHPWLDAVVVAVPPDRGMRIAVAACAAGKDILWDGPLPDDHAAVEGLLRVAAEHGRSVQCVTPALGDVEYLHLIARAAAPGGRVERVRIEYAGSGLDPLRLPATLVDEIAAAVALLGREPRALRVARGRGLAPSGGAPVPRTGLWCDFEDGACLEVVVSHLAHGMAHAATFEVRGADVRARLGRAGATAELRFGADAVAALGTNFLAASRGRDPGLLRSPLSVNLVAQVIRWNADAALSAT